MSKLSDVLGDDAFQKIVDDPVLFVRMFDRDPWDYQADILRSALARDETGKFKHRINVLSTPRQNGKSTISGWAALWSFFTEENQEIISVANDRDQAKIILDDARRIIRNSEILFNMVEPRYGLSKSEIRLINGNRWIIKSADAVFSRGLRPSVVCYDELGFSRDAELFNVLSAGMAARENLLIIVTSTVGPVKAGILWDLFELARADNPDINLVYHSENLSLLITDAFLETQRAVLPPNIYAMEHLNTWSEGSDIFAAEQDWQRAIDEGNPLRDTDPGPSYIFVDLGWAHDETVICAGRKRDDKIDIMAIEVFRGTQAHNVVFSAVEQRIQELAHNLNARKIEIESPQGVGMVQQLQVKGVSAQLTYPTPKANQAHWGALYTALKNGGIRLPNDAKLRRQLLTLTIKSGPTGWKVQDVPSIHQDRARAVAGVCAMIKAGQYVPLPKNQPMQASRWNVDGEVAGTHWARRFSDD